MAVETDYIIRVQPIEGDGSRGRNNYKKAPVSLTTNGLRGDTDVDVDGDDDEAYDDPGDFGVFMLSKTYSAFRTLGHQLKKAADKFTSKADRLPIAVQRAAQYAETFIHLVEGQRPEYLGKVRVVQSRMHAGSFIRCLLCVSRFFNVIIGQLQLRQSLGQKTRANSQ
jgi:hypothetical protein